MLGATKELKGKTYAEKVVPRVLAVEVALAVSFDVGDVEFLVEGADGREHFCAFVCVPEISKTGLA